MLFSKKEPFFLLTLYIPSIPGLSPEILVYPYQSLAILAYPQQFWSILYKSVRIQLILIYSEQCWSGPSQSWSIPSNHSLSQFIPAILVNPYP